MNQINPKKLLHSKWQAVSPTNKEKHFIVTKVRFDETEKVSLCVLEAVYSHNQYHIDWRILKDKQKWLPGWK
ncbi:TIGR02450 family Trp-rich protein [Thalassotalea aquiviva]|uniref:TIGR02450 family Trp-rich protein n=1 Tax=Thalassotalea aquiviva TaxID=3242415 RepID=UPI00352A7C68